MATFEGFDQVAGWLGAAEWPGGAVLRGLRLVRFGYAVLVDFGVLGGSVDSFGGGGVRVVFDFDGVQKLVVRCGGVDGVRPCVVLERAGTEMMFVVDCGGFPVLEVVSRGISVAVSDLPG